MEIICQKCEKMCMGKDDIVDGKCKYCGGDLFTIEAKIDGKFTAQKEPSGNKGVEATPELLKEVATDFFYWWHHQPGTNTQEGYDTWYKINRKRFGI